MYLYILPPFSLIVAVLAYVFQSRVADRRAGLEQPEQGAPVRVLRGSLHAVAVLFFGISGAFVASWLINTTIGDGGWLDGVWRYVATLVCFVAGVTSTDMAVEWVLAGMMEQGRETAPRSLPLRDMLCSEWPDVALLHVVMLVYAW